MIVDQKYVMLLYKQPELCFQSSAYAALVARSAANTNARDDSREANHYYTA